ncbi:MAG: hypothetical protein EPO42_09215 [Gallionellaceae bacterium]|nr:MAG: hypothetical protein EPO42_09215 [Gallionellaceae bacterium]
MRGKKQTVGEVEIVADNNAAHALLAHCPDIGDCPKTWSYEESDLAPGHLIVEFFKPFLLHLLAKKLAASTLRRHRDHMWMLGGEVIRRQEYPLLCNLPVEKVTFDLLAEDGAHSSGHESPRRSKTPLTPHAGSSIVSSRMRHTMS